ncbi:MAG: hypothetical protein HQK79_18475, partial [Desulfobacterales bacterium]|nr:hypothetical protein [Desulfobacterales bacterium]
MSTSAEAIKSAILSHLKESKDFNISNQYSWLDSFISAVAKGVYDEL